MLKRLMNLNLKVLVPRVIFICFGIVITHAAWSHLPAERPQVVNHGAVPMQLSFLQNLDEDRIVFRFKTPEGSEVDLRGMEAKLVYDAMNKLLEEKGFIIVYQEVRTKQRGGNIGVRYKLNGWGVGKGN